MRRDLTNVLTCLHTAMAQVTLVVSLEVTPV